MESKRDFGSRVDSYTHLTTDPSDPALGRGVGRGPMNDKYLVLPDEDREDYVRPVRLSYIHGVCGALTSMARPIAETYARDPKFYGATYCCSCRGHFPVSEFVWENDGTTVGS